MCYKYRYQLGPSIEETHRNFENMHIFLEKKNNQTLAEQKTVEYALNKKVKKERCYFSWVPGCKKLAVLLSQCDCGHPLTMS